LAIRAVDVDGNIQVLLRGFRVFAGNPEQRTMILRHDFFVLVVLLSR
jgi:hypothetical protein